MAIFWICPYVDTNYETCIIAFWIMDSLNDRVLQKMQQAAGALGYELGIGLGEAVQMMKY